MIGHPMDEIFMGMVRDKLIPNCPVSAQDAVNGMDLT